MNIFCDVKVIINIKEIKLVYLPKDSKRDDSQNDINDKLMSALTDSLIIDHSLYTLSASRREAI